MKQQELEGRLVEVGVPGHMIEGLSAYVMEGRPIGSFLTAVLENKFLEVHKRADSVNLLSLHEIAMAVYNEIPSGCHGSPEKVEAWIGQGGMQFYEHPDTEYDRKRDDELTEV